jgi:pimeloyl-ACP methyl ester carboxylesterase
MSPRRRRIVLAGVVGTVLVVLVLSVVWDLPRRFVYFPDSTSVPPAGQVLPGAEDVLLHTEDGLDLGGWWLPARERRRDLAVLVANGNGGDRTARAPLAEALAGEGFDVLLFDYRGYGGNPGAPSEEGLARDVRAARAFLVGQGYAADRMIYFGESLGTAVVTELATQHPPAAMMLRSPFVDLAALGHVHYPGVPVPLVLHDRYPLVEHLQHVAVPVTVVLGTSDLIVPPDQSRTVARATPNLFRLVELEGTGHNDLTMLNGAAVIGAVVELAEQVDRAG